MIKVAVFLSVLKVLKKEIKVVETHLDFNNHVNNLVYLQWAMDISREHWLSEISTEMDNQYFWMVRSHHVEYRKQAFLGELLRVETFVNGYRGPFSDRVVKIFRDKELLAEVVSNWCLIERSSQKLKRVPEEIQCLFK